MGTPAPERIAQGATIGEAQQPRLLACPHRARSTQRVDLREQLGLPPPYALEHVAKRLAQLT